MTNTKYEDKLFTPMGAIGIMRNGVVFYNWAVNENTLVENQSYGKTKGSTKLILNNYSSIQSSIGTYQVSNEGTETSSRSILSRSYHQRVVPHQVVLHQVVLHQVASSSSASSSSASSSSASSSSASSSSASSSSASNQNSNIIYDQQKGTIDKNNIYHYHCYPITVEGMITMGTIQERDPNGTEIFIDNNLLSDNTKIKFYIGYTYYLNQSGPNNDLTNNVSFPIRLFKDSETSPYSFDNTLQINGNPGQGYNSPYKI